MISGIIKGWEAASRFFSFPGFKRRTIFRNHSLKDPGLAGKVRENLQKSRPVVLLYFDLVKFHKVEQVSGFQAASKILAMFKKAWKEKYPKFSPVSKSLPWKISGVTTLSSCWRWKAGRSTVSCRK